MIQRNIEDAIRLALSDTPVVLLNGARQTGKTTLAQAVSETTGARYLTLDDAATLALVSDDPTGFVRNLSGPIVLDEVQKAPDLFPAIKGRWGDEGTPTLRCRLLGFAPRSPQLVRRPVVVRWDSLADSNLLGSSQVSPVRGIVSGERKHRTHGARLRPSAGERPGGERMLRRQGLDHHAEGTPKAPPGATASRPPDHPGALLIGGSATPRWSARARNPRPGVLSITRCPGLGWPR